VIFTPTAIDGVMIVDLEPLGDDRGFFARFFCAGEFEQHGLTAPREQGNLSFASAPGTVRGIHWQAGDTGEAKLSRCIRGAIFDVAVDVRPDSPTYLQHVSVELTTDNRRALYLPEGVGHGFQTLLPDTEALYLVSVAFEPASERGIRPDDPALGIDWPLPIGELSPKDQGWPLLNS
jgi:dTDP-4-dehydrorhamnose 3,5-epimerase